MTKEETLNVKLPTELLNQLREKSLKKFGPKRGYLKKATTEALEDWLNRI